MNWHPLCYAAINDEYGRVVLIVRPNGRGFYGQIVDVTPDYVELQNGDFKNMVRFGTPASFTVIEVPGLNLSVGAPRLFR